MNFMKWEHLPEPGTALNMGEPQPQRDPAPRPGAGCRIGREGGREKGQEYPSGTPASQALDKQHELFSLIFPIPGQGRQHWAHLQRRKCRGSGR